MTTTDNQTSMFLHPTVARQVEAFDHGSGVDFKHLSIGSEVQVKTRNSEYAIVKTKDGATIQGGRWKSPAPIFLAGSSCGGALLHMGWIDVGTNLEFQEKATGNNYLTSAIQSAEVTKK